MAAVTPTTAFSVGAATPDMGGDLAYDNYSSDDENMPLLMSPASRRLAFKASQSAKPVVVLRAAAGGAGADSNGSSLTSSLPTTTPTAGKTRDTDVVVVVVDAQQPNKPSAKAAKRPSASKRIGRLFTLTGLAYVVCIAWTVVCPHPVSSAAVPSARPQGIPATGGGSPDVVVVVESSKESNVIVGSRDAGGDNGGTGEKQQVVAVIASTTASAVEETTLSSLNSSTAVVESSSSKADGSEVPDVTTTAALDAAIAGSDDNNEALNDAEEAGAANDIATEVPTSAPAATTEEFIGEYVTKITIRDEACGQEPPEFIVKKGQKKNISFWIPADPSAVERLRTSTQALTTEPDTSTEPADFPSNDNATVSGLGDEAATQRAPAIFQDSQDNELTTDGQPAVQENDVADDGDQQANLIDAGKISGDERIPAPERETDSTTTTEKQVVPDAENVPVTSSPSEMMTTTLGLKASDDDDLKNDAIAEANPDITQVEDDETPLAEKAPSIDQAAAEIQSDDVSPETNQGVESDGAPLIPVESVALTPPSQNEIPSDERNETSTTESGNRAMTTSTETPPTVVTNSALQPQMASLETTSSPRLQTTTAQDEASNEPEPQTPETTEMRQPPTTSVPAAQEVPVEKAVTTSSPQTSVAATTISAKLNPLSPSNDEGSGVENELDQLLNDVASEAGPSDKDGTTAGATDLPTATAEPLKTPVTDPPKPEEADSQPQVPAEVPNTSVNDLAKTLNETPTSANATTKVERQHPEEEDDEEPIFMNKLPTRKTGESAPESSEKTNDDETAEQIPQAERNPPSIEADAGIKEDVKVPKTEPVPSTTESNPQLTTTEEEEKAAANNADPPPEEVSNTSTTEKPALKNDEPQNFDDSKSPAEATTAPETNEIKAAVKNSQATEKPEDAEKTDAANQKAAEIETSATGKPTEAVPNTDTSAEPAELQAASNMADEKVVAPPSNVAEAPKTHSAEQELKRSQPDEVPGVDSSVRQDNPKEDEVLAAIYGLLGATGPADDVQEAEAAPLKSVLRKRKANEADLMTEMPEVTETTTIPDASSTIPDGDDKGKRRSGNDKKPAANYRTVDIVHSAHDYDSPHENRVRGTGENNSDKPSNAGNRGGFWNFFLNAYNNAGTGTSFWDRKNGHNNNSSNTGVSRPDPFQVIPAPQLGKSGSRTETGPDDVNEHKNKRIKTEEIKDGGITRLIVGSYTLEDEDEPMPSSMDHASRHTSDLQHGGQALSVSYKLAVVPHEAVYHEDGVIAGYEEPHPVAGSLYPGSGVAKDRVDSSGPAEFAPELQPGSSRETSGDQQFTKNQPRVTYDWIPSNGPQKTRPFDDDNLFSGTVEDASIGDDERYNHRPQQPHPPREYHQPAFSRHRLNEEADIEVEVAYNPSTKTASKDKSKPKPSAPAKKHHSNKVFLPGEFVKAKFQPEDLAVVDDDKTQSVFTSDRQVPITGTPVKIESVIPDEKIKIPFVVQSEMSSSGQGEGEEGSVVADNVDQKAMQPEMIPRKPEFPKPNLEERTPNRPLPQRPAAKSPMKSANKIIINRAEPTTRTPTVATAGTTWKTTEKPMRSGPSKTVPYPILKSKETMPDSATGNEELIEDLRHKAELETPKTPATAISATFPGTLSARAPPGNGIENVVQGMKKSQYPNVVIISGKSNTRQQLREEDEDVDPVEAVRRKDEKFYRFLGSQPFEMQEAFLRGSPVKTNIRVQRDVSAVENPEIGAGNGISCDWSIKAEDPSLFLLVTFRNLSAPFSPSCDGAYIEIERENNGYKARWCDTKMPDADGARQNIILARSEVRLRTFDDETGGKAVATGFDAEVEVIDLRDSSNYEKFRTSTAYGQLRRLTLG